MGKRRDTRTMDLFDWEAAPTAQTGSTTFLDNHWPMMADPPATSGRGTIRGKGK